MKTAQGLVEYVQKAFKDGWVYWYGTTGKKCTQDLLNQKARQYPKHYTSDRMATYKRHIAEGRYCADCINLAKGFMWLDEETGRQVYASNNCPDTNADGMYNRAKVKGNISTMPDEPGIMLHMAGHAGVYVGEGKVIEARGFNYGVVMTELSKRKWLHWYRLPCITYEPIAPADPMKLTEKVNPFTEPTKNVKQGAIGDAVKWVQWELSEHGYDIGSDGIDGDFGKNTKAAVLKFQTDAGLEVDGIVGKLTRSAFKAV